MPLKIIHYYLDHPQVASVLLTNNLLDAAKTNRGILINQSMPSESDLKQLARGCLFGNETIQTGAEEDKFVQALCSAFAKTNDFCKDFVNELFHLRDFIYFLRRLNKVGFENQNGFGRLSLSNKDIVSAIERNFNGISKGNLKKLVQMFFDEINQKLGEIRGEIRNPTQIRPVIEVLKESLTETLRENENPNTSAFRYVMIFDPTDSRSSVSLLSSLNLVPSKNLVVCTLGEFSQDNSDSARSSAVLKVKDAMANGKTVILINSDPIRSSFYDVFNRHFSSLTTEG